MLNGGNSYIIHKNETGIVYGMVDGVLVSMVTEILFGKFIAV